MQRRLTFVALLFALFLLNACQTTATIKTTDLTASHEPVRVNPVDVQTKFITTQAISPQALDVSSGNLFDNGGFESGLDGWTACSTGAIKTSGDAFEGSGALEIVPDNCFYRSAEVSAGQDLVLSCYVKVIEGSGWTGMGMGFADSSWATVGEAPATVISGSSYARYDVEFTAPANTTYASMWIYSENKAVVDNCSLMLESTPPPPPPPSGDNLLENGDFETLANGLPTEWSVGCGGTATSVVGRSGKGFSLKGGVCVDQGLSAGDVAALSGNDYTYSCYAKNTGGYASLSIFFNDSPKSVVIPVSSSYQLIELKGTAPQASSGFVSIYSEGNLTVDQCSLTAGDVAPPPPPPPPPSGDNLLENGGFETLNANSKPVNWSKGCGGSYDRVVGRSGNGLSLTGGACADQPLSSSDLVTLANKEYTYSCYAKNTGGYASMSIFFDDVPVSTVIPQSSDFQLVEVSDIAPSASTGFVSIYSEAGLVVDDCSVTVEDAQPVTCVDPVNIPDPVLNELVRNQTGRLTGDITCQDMLSITEIIKFPTLGGNPPPEQRIFTLEGLQFAANLKDISIAGNLEITDLSPLASLTQLESIALQANNIIDLSPLSNLPNLTFLNVSSNQISDISPLQSITTLESLNIGNNPLTDLSPLEFLPNLQSVSLLFLDLNLTTLSSLIANSGISAGDTIVTPFTNNSSNFQYSLELLNEIDILRSRGVLFPNLN